MCNDPRENSAATSQGAAARPARPAAFAAPRARAARSGSAATTTAAAAAVSGEHDPVPAIDGGRDSAVESLPIQRRPPLAADATEGELVFMLLDTTHLDAAITLWGVTMHGASVCLVIDDFMPYFYCEAPEDDTRDGEFAAILDGELRDDKRLGPKPHVVRVERVAKRSLLYFSSNVGGSFYKVFCARPSVIGPAVKVMEKTGKEAGLNTDTYESQDSKSASYEMRFMVDRQLAGGGWVRCGKWRQGDSDNSGVVAQLFGTALASEISGVWPGSDALEFQRLAPLRMLSADVVCTGQRRQLHAPPGTGPDDQIILITVQLSQHTSANPDDTVALVLQPPGTALSSLVWPAATEDWLLLGRRHVVCFPDEAGLLAGFEQLVETADPDFITGSDIGPDLQLLLQRAAVVGLQNFGAFRRDEIVTKVKKRQTCKSPQSATSDFSVCIPAPHS